MNDPATGLTKEQLDVLAERVSEHGACDTVTWKTLIDDPTNTMVGREYYRQLVRIARGTP